MPAAIPILVEVTPLASEFCAAPAAETFRRQLAADICLMLTELGLEGAPAVELRIGRSGRAIRVYVHGRWQPCPANLLKRVWQALSPPPLRAATDKSAPINPGFRDGWLSQWLIESDASPDEETVRAFLDFLRGLALEIVRLRPSCLICEEIATDYGGSAQSPSAEEAASLRCALEMLLDWGATASQKTLLIETIRFGCEIGRGREDTIELAFARLRKKAIEIHLHPEYARAIIPGLEGSEYTPGSSPKLAPRLREIARTLDNNAFQELGLVLPGIGWVQSPAVPPGLLVFRINDQPGAPIRGLQPGEWLVNTAAAGQQAGAASPLLQRHGARPAGYPASGGFAILCGGEEPELAAAGLQAWDAVDFIYLCASTEIRRHAARLFDIEDAENILARLETIYPALVHLALERFSLGVITRVLRGLLAEQNSIRNLRAILERMIEFETIRGFDSSQFVVFDDRFVIPPARPEGSPPGWSDILEFVQSGMKPYFTSKLFRPPALPVLGVAPALEERLSGGSPPCDPLAPAPLTAGEELSLLDQVWQYSGDADGTNPPVFVSPSARYAMRRILRAEFPDLPVVAPSQLNPAVRIEAVGQIHLGEPR